MFSSAPPFLLRVFFLLNRLDSSLVCWSVSFGILVDFELLFFTTLGFFGRWFVWSSWLFLLVILHPRCHALADAEGTRPGGMVGGEVRLFPVAG
jgi:hypothetical protein